MRLIFVRHPETEANVKRLIYGRTDSAYSEKGEASVEKVVNHMADKHIDAIYSSPLRRAAFLAEAIAENHSDGSRKLEVIKDDRLQEMHFGIFENKTNKEAEELYGEGYDQFWHDFANFDVPEGENLGQVKERVVDFLNCICANGTTKKSLRELMKEDPEKVLEQQHKKSRTVIIVAHALVIKSALSFLLNMPLDKIWHIDIQPAAIVQVSYHNGFGVLTELRST